MAKKNFGHHDEAVHKMVQQFRAGILLSMPVARFLADSTQTKIDDTLVKGLEILSTNDELAELLCQAIHNADHPDDPIVPTV